MVTKHQQATTKHFLAVSLLAGAKAAGMEVKLGKATVLITGYAGYIQAWNKVMFHHREEVLCLLQVKGLIAGLARAASKVK